MAEPLEGISTQQLAELQAMLDRLARLWSDLTIAGTNHDQRHVEDIQAEIAVCRKRVEEIKRGETRGSARYWSGSITTARLRCSSPSASIRC